MNASVVESLQGRKKLSAADVAAIALESQHQGTSLDAHGHNALISTASQFQYLMQWVLSCIGAHRKAHHFIRQQLQLAAEPPRLDDDEDLLRLHVVLVGAHGRIGRHLATVLESGAWDTSINSSIKVHGVVRATSARDLQTIVSTRCDVLVLACLPAHLQALASDLRGALQRHTCVLSLLADVPELRIRGLLGIEGAVCAVSNCPTAAELGMMDAAADGSSFLHEMLESAVRSYVQKLASPSVMQDVYLALGRPKLREYDVHAIAATFRDYVDNIIRASFAQKPISVALQS
eukprot:ANDGO_06128.mRNA.1 hypothetical protein